MIFSDIELPEWLYEPLPYAYMAGGTLFTLLGDTALHGFGGAALALAGVLIWKARRTYRQAARHHEHSKRE